MTDKTDRPRRIVRRQVVAPICRHSPGDPNCSSSPAGQAREAAYREQAHREEMTRKQKAIDARTPKPDQYEIEEAEPVGPHLVLKVRYPSCTACAYEGTKIMVYLDMPLQQAMKWRRIDPHFRQDKGRSAKEAPSPAARFPASPEGWQDALSYARSKGGVPKP